MSPKPADLYTEGSRLNQPCSDKERLEIVSCNSIREVCRLKLDVPSWPAFSHALVTNRRIHDRTRMNPGRVRRQVDVGQQIRVVGVSGYLFWIRRIRNQAAVITHRGTYPEGLANVVAEKT